MGKNFAEKFWEFLEREVRYEENSALVPLPDADPRKVAVARKWNFIEAVTVYALILIVVWTSMLTAPWMYPAFAILLIWVLVISPILHYKYEKDIFVPEDKRNVWWYLFEGRGFGSPKRYFFAENGEPPLFKKYLKEIIIMIVLLDILGIIALIHYADRYYDILRGWGLEPTPATAVGVGALLVAVISVLLFVGFSVLVRFDTLEKSIKYMLYILAIGVPFILFFAVIFYLFPGLPMLSDKDPAKLFAEFTITGYIGQFFGYIFWGYLQQVLFLAVFNTYFSRAFDITKVKGQIAAAFPSALFFGLIHLPVFWLSIFTWIAGFMWSLYFMKCKNLWIMGVCHGALGTLLNRLTPVPFSVGPKVVM